MNMKKPFIFLLFLSLPLLKLLSQDGYAKPIKKTPEEEALFISKHLKPIPNDEWNGLAGPHSTEQYTVSKGDTLYEISKRLFGDAKYWPKVWSLNNNNITNPHKINPGVLIAFSPGTGNSLPAVSLHSGSQQDSFQDTSSATDAPVSLISKNRKKPKSMEWKNLPEGQRWENIEIQIPKEVDPLGFDTRSKIHFVSRSNGYEPIAIPATSKIPFLAQIIGSRSEGELLSQGDTVYIRADEKIQIGETYAITREPYILKSSQSERVGYSYPILGKVKILAVRDNLFVGNVVSAKEALFRGNSLIPVPSPIKDMTPIEGPSSIHGVIMMDHDFSTYTTAQHKEVFIDRGSDDGIKSGMVFRVYEHYDPANSKKLTESDFIIDGDILVLKVSETFSSGLVIYSKIPLIEHSTAILLTDVSDLLKHKDFNEKGVEKRDELNELDQLDSDESLGEKEKRELKQLEKWKGNPLPNPDDPNDATLPPPPDDNTIPLNTTAPIDGTAPIENAAPPPPTTDVTPPVDAQTYEQSEAIPPPPAEDAPPPEEGQSAAPLNEQAAPAPLPPVESKLSSPEDIIVPPGAGTESPPTPSAAPPQTPELPSE
jgi:hypothetical protein